MRDQLDLMLPLVLFDVLIDFLNVAASSSSDDNGVKLQLAAAPGRADQEQLPSDVDDRDRNFVLLNTLLHYFLDLLPFLRPELDWRIFEELHTFLLK